MILPSKHLSEDRALITIGAEVLRQLGEPKTVSRLWTELKRGHHAAITYDWFVLGLDLLYAIGLVEFLARPRCAHGTAGFRPTASKSSAMIECLESSLDPFKAFTFKPGLNVVLAQKSPGATDLQTRNGVGKSSFVELIHFMLGGSAGPKHFRSAEPLAEAFISMRSTLPSSRWR